jgi:hypothetical protein
VEAEVTADCLEEKVASDDVADVVLDVEAPELCEPDAAEGLDCALGNMDVEPDICGEVDPDILPEIDPATSMRIPMASQTKPTAGSGKRNPAKMRKV